MAKDLYEVDLVLNWWRDGTSRNDFESYQESLDEQLFNAAGFNVVELTGAPTADSLLEFTDEETGEAYIPSYELVDYSGQAVLHKQVIARSQQHAVRMAAHILDQVMNSAGGDDSSPFIDWCAGPEWNVVY